ncbi:zinc finger MYM-type protein 1-like [Metopolophium dirhodum]|uniref:zinc finger MYM-type protein 1-like n=1 Tax=Metopolophium dirhodum TaxID=44670 RepID=UPI00298F85CE|nr:zinc finger MYM-type protein 1-like [Metopolophium dirhodum]XP_060877871.1 zinc finger MYM-type protein 1-like [Metopolophium dirhodum]XP_060877872.1 zinc finger MYM-type protein 1-like [Metopolophium dirhodum]XP_060877873.1 zinc finger MYM-type protein 1-like [Metopolophium dirhodum]
MRSENDSTDTQDCVELFEETLIQVVMDNADEMSILNANSNVRVIAVDSDSPALQIENKVDLSGVNVDEMCNGKNLMEVQDHNSTEEVQRFPTDPADWLRTSSFIKFCAVHGVDQNKNDNFIESKNQYSVGNVRFCNKTMFFSKLPNGEQISRSWLVYSHKLGKVFCAPCWLFKNESSNLAYGGFNDWKNAHKRLKEHEASLNHKTCLLKLKNLGQKQRRLDSMLLVQINHEKMYWRSVLERVVSVIKTLASRGLPFRGQEEIFGSPKNGNYLMLLELLSEFDPFLAQHISKYGNSASGTSLYLSSTICDEIIVLMSKKVKEVIINEVKSRKYYSIVVDSTPDITHSGQLAFMLRYVSDKGIPTERFLEFIPKVGHTSLEIAETVIMTIDNLKLNISDCRGQSYDTAKNMSGCYNGLQARIKNINPLTFYIPCAAHSLNLVGSHAVECCNEAATFFGLMQNIYIFFSSSTHRWDLLNNNMVLKSRTLKAVSNTRWSSRDSACLSLNKNWSAVLATLTYIMDDNTENNITRNEAKGLMNKMSSLETAIMTVVWSFLLSQLNFTSNKLQNVNIDCLDVLQLYDSLIRLIEQTRENFDDFETEALAKAVRKDYKITTIREKKRKIFHDESNSKNVNLLARYRFKIFTFIPILDKLKTELETRRHAYDIFCKPFTFLTQIKELNNQEIKKSVELLQNIYKNDVEFNDFINEVSHLKAHVDLISIGGKHNLLSLQTFLYEKDLTNIYPNIEIILRIFTCTAVTNCSAERSFSCLKRVKNYLCSTMTQQKMNSLAILNIENQITRQLSFDEIIDNFATDKSRRKMI